MEFACRKSLLNMQENFTATVCNKWGKWDPDPAQFCAIVSGNHFDSLLLKLTLSHNS